MISHGNLIAGITGMAERIPNLKYANIRVFNPAVSYSAVSVNIKCFTILPRYWLTTFPPSTPHVLCSDCGNDPLLLFLSWQWNGYLHRLPAIGSCPGAQRWAGVHLTRLSHWLLITSNLSRSGSCTYSLVHRSSKILCLNYFWVFNFEEHEPCTPFFCGFNRSFVMEMYCIFMVVFLLNAMFTFSFLHFLWLADFVSFILSPPR